MARSQTNDVSFSNGKPVAVLVDGGFFHKRYTYVIQKRDEPQHDAVVAAKNFYTMCLRHAYGESLYRIFYYDCPPLQKKVHAPVSHRAIDFARSPLAGFRIAFLNELKKKRKVAIRLGELAGDSRWVIRPEQTKRLLNGSLSVSEMTDDDLFYDVSQKGVDMKIGLDIASLAYKRQVGRIVLVLRATAILCLPQNWRGAKASISSLTRCGSRFAIRSTSTLMDSTQRGPGPSGCLGDRVLHPTQIRRYLTMTKPILQTECPNLKLVARGKVRDIYDLGEHLLLVASDRISTYDVVFPTGIPFKGKILTQISRYWFDQCAHITPNHVVSFDVADFPAEAQAYKDQLEGRSLMCKKTTPLKIECVVRGYLDGSAWSEYSKEGKIAAGIDLPEGLNQRDQLPEPIFTPATKAESGHDINIDHAQAADIVGKETFEAVRDRAIAIYNFAHEHLKAKGITLCDTKFEFGHDANGDIILIDECLTPDSSRFMVADTYRAGAEPKSFDKQFVRDWVVSTGWQKTPPAPEIPDEIVNQTVERYLEVYKLITGKDLD